MTKDRNFTDEEHEEHCKKAGCVHPALYQSEDGRTVAQGWCKLCRQVAFKI